jgi:magnesium transporter
LKTILSYNERAIRPIDTYENIENGYSTWIDLVDPTKEDVEKFSKKLNLDPECVQTYFSESKRPEIRVLENHTFTVMLDIKNKDPKTLQTNGIYFFLGSNWLLTIHSSEVDLKGVAYIITY